MDIRQSEGGQQLLVLYASFRSEDSTWISVAVMKENVLEMSWPFYKGFKSIGRSGKNLLQEHAYNYQCQRTSCKGRFLTTQLH